MKKIYAILVAACMSVSLFADPTQADLQSYMEEGYYVACFQAPALTTCNDIYWMGEYCGWNISTDMEDLVKCEPLAGHTGWYVAKVPAANGTNGKPIQLNECGKMTWDVQPGTAGVTELVAGSVTIKANGAEYDLEGWSTTEPTIIKIAAWKNDYNPCEMVCEAQSYTIRIYPPYCEYLDELEPTIKGSFNQWGDAITMEFKGSYFEYVSEPVTAGFEFKFNNDAAGSWDHQFEAYDDENDTWTFIPASGNLSLTNGTEFYVYDDANRILTFDFSDDAYFRYAGCEEPVEVDSTLYYTIVALNAPAGAPAAGVEIIGTFDSWGGTAMELLNTGWYFVQLEVIASDQFKFREAGTWDNEIMHWVGDEWKALDNIKFSDVWADDSYHGTPCKWIELDLSAAEYRWTTDVHEGIENVVLTEEAQKVVIDGVLYIIRDNKMYNVHGTQVR
jgi:hypothetical protein